MVVGLTNSRRKVLGVALLLCTLWAVWCRSRSPAPENAVIHIRDIRWGGTGHPPNHTPMPSDDLPTSSASVSVKTLVVMLHEFRAPRAAPLWFGAYKPGSFAPVSPDDLSRDLGFDLWEQFIDGDVDDEGVVDALVSLNAHGPRWAALDGMMAAVASHTSRTGRRQYGPFSKILDGLEARWGEGDDVGVVQLYRAATHADVDGNMAAGHLALDALYRLMDETEDPGLLRAAGHALVTVPIHDYYQNDPEVYMVLDDVVEDPAVRHALAQFAYRESLEALDPSFQAHWAERLVETASALTYEDRASLLDPPTDGLLQDAVLSMNGMGDDIHAVVRSLVHRCAREHTDDTEHPLTGRLIWEDSVGWAWHNWNREGAMTRCVEAESWRVSVEAPKDSLDLLVVPHDGAWMDDHVAWWAAYCNGDTGLLTCDDP